jgi:hypothetical protein
MYIYIYIHMKVQAPNVPEKNCKCDFLIFFGHDGFSVGHHEYDTIPSKMSCEWFGDRVTRLGEFSQIGRFVTLSFLKIK